MVGDAVPVSSPNDSPTTTLSSPDDSDLGQPLVDPPPKDPAPVTTLSPTDTSVTTPPPPVSFLRILSLCIANFGIHCAWSLEFTLTTPYFEHSLSAGKFLSHAVWIVGPLSGLIVAPLVGAASDSCTHRLGRRRPFIAAGVVVSVISMIVFANAVPIASVVFAQRTHQHHVTALVISIVSFCTLDLALNTTMWPVRALQGDVVPLAQQHQLQAVSIIMLSLGDLASNALLNLSSTPVAHIRFAFLVVAMVYSVTVSSLLVLAKETPLLPRVPDEEDDAAVAGRPMHNFNILSYLADLPGWMWRVGISHSLGFFALFCILPYMSSWLGSSVLNGKTEAGVELYSRTSLVRSVIQMVYSGIYPWLLHFTTPGRLMGVSFFAFGTLMLALAGTSDVRLAQLAVMAFGLPVAAHFTLPVAVTVENSNMSNRGRFLGALNCFGVIPQFIDTIYTGVVSNAFGEQAVMRIGAAWAVMAGVFRSST